MTFSLYRILLQNKQEKLKWNLQRKPLTCRLMLLPHILYSIIKLKSLRTNLRMHSFLCIRHPFLSKCLLRRWKRRKLSLVIIFLCKRDWCLIVRSCLFLTLRKFRTQGHCTRSLKFLHVEKNNTTLRCVNHIYTLPPKTSSVIKNIWIGLDFFASVALWEVFWQFRATV